MHANRVHERGFTRPFPPKTGRRREIIDGFDRLRRQLVHVPCARVLHRSRQNHWHGFLFRVRVDNFCRRRWCVWELAKMTRCQKRWHHCWRPPNSGNLRCWSCVLRVSVYRAYLKMIGDQDMCGLECCLEPRLQGMTSQCGEIGLISCQTYRSVRYRVDVPILPKYPVPVSMLCHNIDTGTGSGTYGHIGTALSYRTYRSVRCRY